MVFQHIDLYLIFFICGFEVDGFAVIVAVSMFALLSPHRLMPLGHWLERGFRCLWTRSPPQVELLLPGKLLTLLAGTFCVLLLLLDDLLVVLLGSLLVDECPAEEVLLLGLAP